MVHHSMSGGERIIEEWFKSFSVLSAPEKVGWVFVFIVMILTLSPEIIFIFCKVISGIKFITERVRNIKWTCCSLWRERSQPKKQWRGINKVAQYFLNRLFRITFTATGFTVHQTFQCVRSLFMNHYFSVLMRSGRGVLRWLIWTVKYGVVLPLMTMMIVVVFLFWQADMTPGKIMVREIELTKAGTGAGEFLVRECPLPQTPPGLPVADVPVTGLKSGEGCLVVVTDAAGYAGRVDTNLRDWLANVWLILALMFTLPGVFRRFIRGLSSSL